MGKPVIIFIDGALRTSVLLEELHPAGLQDTSKRLSVRELVCVFGPIDFEIGHVTIKEHGDQFSPSSRTHGNFAVRITHH